MDDHKERDVKERQELKLFIESIIFLAILLFVFTKLNSFFSYADEVIVAEAPYNVGGDEVAGGSSENIIAVITTDGDDQSLQSSVSDIIYAPDSTPGGNYISADSIDGSNSGNSEEINGTDIKDSEETWEAHGDLKQVTSDENVVRATNGDEIYVPDSDDDCPVSALVPLPVDVQEYIWKHCKKVTGDYKNYYAFILGAIQLESEFKRTAIHYNSNGSTDRGLMQINSCNIKECKRAGLITCTDDLWDIYKNIDCGFHEMNNYIRKFGVCESAYFAYNTGRTSGGSNKNSRVVMSNMAQWNTRLFG